MPISSSIPRPLGAVYVPNLLSEVEQQQRPSGNGDREAIVVEAGLCDGEGERAYTVHDPILEDPGRFGKNMAADVSAKKYAETSQAENNCRYGLCDGEGEPAYTVYDAILYGE